MSVPFEGYLVIGKDGNSFDDVVYNGLLKARSYLWMTGAKTTDFIIPNRKTKEAFNFSDRLIQLRNRGVEVKLLLTPRERNRSVYEKLKDERNIDFRFCYDIHMKIFIVDGTWMYFGSANLTGAGLGSRTRKGRNNFEVGAITIDKEPIVKIGRLFAEIWQGKYCAGCHQKKRGYCPGID